MVKFSIYLKRYVFVMVEDFFFFFFFFLYFQNDHYGGSDLDKVVANIKCTGKEERLEDCTIEKTQHTPGHEVCSKATSVAGVICETSKACNMVHFRNYPNIRTLYHLIVPYLP